MLPRLHTAAIVFAVAALAPGEARGSDRADRTVTVSAQFATRTSLQISTSVLRFVVPEAGQSAEATVEFTAAARTRQGGEVVLTVEPIRAAGKSLQVSLGAGSATQPLGGGPCVAERWTGSGRRTGQLTFVLNDAPAGTHAVPVQVVLSTP